MIFSASVRFDPEVDCSAGVFWACECTFLYKATILDLVTVEDWGEEIFATGVGIKWKNGQVGRGRGRGRKNIYNIVILSAPPPIPPPPRLCTNPLPVKHPIIIQDGSIKNLIYLAFHSKIMPALQANPEVNVWHWTLAQVITFSVMSRIERSYEKL